MKAVLDLRRLPEAYENIGSLAILKSRLQMRPEILNDSTSKHKAESLAIDRAWSVRDMGDWLTAASFHPSIRLRIGIVLLYSLCGHTKLHHQALLLSTSLCIVAPGFSVSTRSHVLRLSGSHRPSLPHPLPLHRTFRRLLRHLHQPLSTRTLPSLPFTYRYILVPHVPYLRSISRPQPPLLLAAGRAPALDLLSQGLEDRALRNVDV